MSYLSIQQASRVSGRDDLSRLNFTLSIQPTRPFDLIMQRVDHVHQLFQFLSAGDASSCSGVLQAMEESGESVASRCEAIASAFHLIGEVWESGDVAVYREHVASQIGQRLIHEMLANLDFAPSDAPVAVGCAPEKDPYVLPTTMVELVLRDLGWQASSLGAGLPLDQLRLAIDHYQPKIAWVSVSYTESPADAQRALAELQTHCRERSTHLVCGGRALPGEIRATTGLACLENLPQLVEFARGVCEA